MYAGSLKCLCTLDLNDTHTAAADFIYIFEETEGRNSDVYFFSSLENRIVLRHVKLDTVDGNIYFVHNTYAPFLLRILEDCLERTFFHTQAALDAFVLIDGEWCCLVSGDALYRTVFLTDTAVLAGIVVDDVFNHGLTYAGRTLLVNDV